MSEEVRGTAVPRMTIANCAERATGKSAGGAELKRCPGGAFAVGESETEAW